MIVGIDTIRSDDGGHRGTGGGGGEEQGWIVEEEEYTVYIKRYVRWQIWQCMYVHGMACMCGIYLRRYLSITYLVYSCDVSPLLQEQGADDFTASPGCTV